MATSEFYEFGPLAQVAVNLFHGWGYNFYRHENQLRADNMMVRANAGALLQEALAGVLAADSDYRRANMPAPTRAKPFPDAAVVANARLLERLAAGIGAAEAQIRTQPTPESDRMSELFRKERDVLMRLTETDQQLIGQAELLRAKISGASATTILAALTDLDAGLAAIATTLRIRQAIMITPA